MIKIITNLLNGLCSNTDPGAISHAFACGILLGFIPKNNILWYLIFFFVFFLRIQRSFFLLSVILGAILGALVDPVFNEIGFRILQNQSLIPYFAKMLEVPFVAFTKFNNTIVMGSLVCGIVAYVPMYFLAWGFVKLWRAYLASQVSKLHLVKVIKQIPLITKISELMAGY